MNKVKSIALENSRRIENYLEKLPTPTKPRLRTYSRSFQAPEVKGFVQINSQMGVRLGKIH